MINKLLCFGKRGIRVAEADSLSAQGLQQVKAAIASVAVFNITVIVDPNSGDYTFEIPEEVTYANIKAALTAGKSVTLIEARYAEDNDPSAERIYQGTYQYNTVHIVDRTIVFNGIFAIHNSDAENRYVAVIAQDGADDYWEAGTFFPNLPE